MNVLLNVCLPFMLFNLFTGDPVKKPESSSYFLLQIFRYASVSTKTTLAAIVEIYIAELAFGTTPETIVMNRDLLHKNKFPLNLLK